jgi:SAM-dependent methyltransferase
MRRFTPEYLETTRTGMWDDSREALADLGLATRERVLDAGAGSGELTRVLREQSAGTVVALDADPALLAHAPAPRLVGDATRLPFVADAFDLVGCQALLINLPNPLAALGEFTRVSTDRVAAIEPDNSAVNIASTVDAEPALARRARELYLRGVETDPTLGPARDLFERAGLVDITVARYDHVRTIAPPCTETDIESARRKASGAGLADDRATVLAGGTTPEEFDTLRAEWRAMGRAVVDQMQHDAYRRRETVPFYVTVGRVPADS